MRARISTHTASALGKRQCSASKRKLRRFYAILSATEFSSLTSFAAPTRKIIFDALRRTNSGKRASRRRRCRRCRSRRRTSIITVIIEPRSRIQKSSVSSLPRRPTICVVYRSCVQTLVGAHSLISLPPSSSVRRRALQTAKNAALLACRKSSEPKAAFNYTYADTKIVPGTSKNDTAASGGDDDDYDDDDDEKRSALAEERSTLGQLRKRIGAKSRTKMLKCDCGQCFRFRHQRV